MSVLRLCEQNDTDAPDFPSDVCMLSVDCVWIQMSDESLQLCDFEVQKKQCDTGNTNSRNYCDVKKFRIFGGFCTEMKVIFKKLHFESFFKVAT